MITIKHRRFLGRAGKGARLLSIREREDFIIAERKRLISNLETRQHHFKSAEERKLAEEVAYTLPLEVFY